MTERRSGRQREVINYAKLSECGEDSDDDDFKEAKTPPGKRARIPEDKNKKIKSKAGDKKNRSSQSSPESSLKTEVPGKRLSIDEKVFQRQMKIVLELSKDKTNKGLNKSSTNNPEESSCTNVTTEKSRVDEKRNCVEDISDEDEDFQACKPSSQRSKNILPKSRSRIKASDGDCSEDMTSEAVKHEKSTSKSHQQLNSSLQCARSEEKVHSGADENTAENPINTVCEAPPPLQYRDSIEEFPPNFSIGEEVATSSTLLNGTSIPCHESLEEEEEEEMKELPPPLLQNNCTNTYTKAAANNKRLKISSKSPEKKYTPTMLPAKMLRIGLSRKAVVKPLHVGVKLS